MGLSLGVRAGSKILIGAQEVNVLKVSQTEVEVETFDLIRTRRVVKLTEQERVELFPEVFCSVGKVDLQAGNSYTRLVFEAPRTIAIERT